MKIEFEILDERYVAALEYVAALKNATPSDTAMLLLIELLKARIEAGDVTGLAIPNFGGDHE